MKSKKIAVTEYKYGQLFIDKKTNELVEFMCTGLEGILEVVVLRGKDKKNLIYIPIDQFNNFYTIDKEYAHLLIYSKGKKKNFLIESFTPGNSINAMDLQILVDRGIETLGTDKYELVTESFNGKTLTTFRKSAL